MNGTETNAVLASLLLAFGVAVPFPAFGGGMLLALGCCYGVRAFRPMEGRKSLFLSLFTAVLAAMLTAGLQKNTSGVWIWGELPLQVQMAIAGAMSQAIFELIASRGSSALGKLADRFGAGK
jgi:hypothetical protein